MIEGALGFGQRKKGKGFPARSGQSTPHHSGEGHAIPTEGAAPEIGA
jgi:hypothetical protein